MDIMARVTVLIRISGLMLVLAPPGLCLQPRLRFAPRSPIELTRRGEQLALWW
jgi:hypothetical protein